VNEISTLYSFSPEMYLAYNPGSCENDNEPSGSTRSGEFFV